MSEGAFVMHLRVGASAAFIYGDGKGIHVRKLNNAFSYQFSDVVKCELSPITDIL